MRINYNKKDDALYIRFHEAPYSESEEVKNGVIIDYDSAGRVIGFEVLDVSRNLPHDFLKEIQSESLKVDLARQ